MVLEEPHLQSQLHEEGQNEDLTTNDESVEILPDEAVLSSRSTASNKVCDAATEEKSFLLAPPNEKGLLSHRMSLNRKTRDFARQISGGKGGNRGNFGN